MADAQPNEFPDDTDDCESPIGDIHLCVLFESSKVGIAYYDSCAESLHVSSTFCTESEFPWLAGILREQIVSPIAVITGSTSSEAVRRELSLKVLENGSMIESGVTLKVLKQNSCK